MKTLIDYLDAYWKANDHRYNQMPYSLTGDKLSKCFFTDNRSGYPDCMQDDAVLNTLASYLRDNYASKGLAPNFFRLAADGSIFCNNEEEEAGLTSTNTRIKRAISTALTARAYSIQGMWEVMEIEYDPQNNYDKTSTITTSYEGQEHSVRSELGDEHVNTIQNGKVTDTRTQSGSETNSTVRSGKEATENDVTGYNTSDLQKEGKSTTEYGADGTTRKDETTLSFSEDREDKTERDYENMVQNTTRNFEGRQTTDDRSFEGRQDVVTERTMGNIGVTTTMELLTSQVDWLKLMDFYRFTAEIITDAFCVDLWDDAEEVDWIEW